MFLESITIKNFRLFRDFHIDFCSPDLNVIVGENGCGKSTIFDAIRLLFDESIYSKSFLGESDFVDGKSVFIEGVLKVEISSQEMYLMKEGIFEVGSDFVRVRFGLYQEREGVNPIYYGKKNFSAAEVVEVEEIEKFKVNKNDFKDAISILYIDGTRSFKDFYEQKGFYYEFLKKTNEEVNLLDPLKNILKINIDNIKTINHIKQIFSEGDNGLLKYLAQVNLLQDAARTVNLDTSPIKFRTLYSLLKLQLEGKFLDQNSVGRQYIFFTIFSIFYLKEVRDNLRGTTKSHYFVLMEEPEVHLHPQMQRNLLNFLKSNMNSKEFTLMISTHSPGIIRAVQDIQKILYINTLFSLRTLKIDSADETMLKKLNIRIDISKAELYFARGIIFVEGITEELLIPLIFELSYGLELEKYGISVININGTDFYDYCRLANQLKIPFVVITDGDITKDENYHGATRKGKHPSLFTDENFFTGQDTFEVDFLANGNVSFGDSIIESLVSAGESQQVVANFRQALSALLTYINDNGIDNSDFYKNLRNSVLETYLEKKVGKSKIAYDYFKKVKNNNTIIVSLPTYISDALNKIKQRLLNYSSEVLLEQFLGDTVTLQLSVPNNNITLETASAISLNSAVPEKENMPF